MTPTPDRLRQPRTEAGRPDRLTQAVARALFAARAAGFENETEGELYRMAGNFREAYAVTPTFIEALGEYGYRMLAIEDEAASPVPAPTLRDQLREKIGTTDEEHGLEHWHFARGGRTSPGERAGVFVDRGQVLDAIDEALG